MAIAVVKAKFGLLSETRAILIGAFLLYLTGGFSSPVVHLGDLYTLQYKLNVSDFIGTDGFKPLL